MDLRYQNPNRPWGFYGLKDGILLRSPSKPDHVPDWDFYDHQDRYQIIQEQIEQRTVSLHKSIILQRWYIPYNKHKNTNFHMTVYIISGK